MPKSSINYKGKVTIRVKDKPAIRNHNDGTNHLFNLICNVLTQVFSNDWSELHTKLPAYMTIVRNEGVTDDEQLFNFSKYDEELQEESILLHSLPITNREVRSVAQNTSLEPDHKIKFSCH